MTFLDVLIYGSATIGALSLLCTLGILVLAVRATSRPSPRALARIALVEAQTAEELAIRRAARILAGR